FCALCAPFFGVAPFFEEVVSGPTVALCSATVAVCSVMAAMFSVVVASAVFMVVNPFCAWRMTIDHSSWVERQEKSGYHAGESGRGERLAMGHPGGRYAIRVYSRQLRTEAAPAWGSSYSDAILREVISQNGVHLSGFLAWLAWAGVHL